MLGLTTLVKTSSLSKLVRRPEEMQFHTAQPRHSSSLDSGMVSPADLPTGAKQSLGGISIQTVQNATALRVVLSDHVLLAGNELTAS